jgi:hypothetical protein
MTYYTIIIKKYITINNIYSFLFLSKLQSVYLSGRRIELNGVITLSGYCTSANNHELIFAIMLNDIKSSITAKALEDELCTIMTHDETFIPKKKVIVVKHRPVRRRTAARKRRRRR